MAYSLSFICEQQLKMSILPTSWKSLPLIMPYGILCFLDLFKLVGGGLLHSLLDSFLSHHCFSSVYIPGQVQSVISSIITYILLTSNFILRLQTSLFRLHLFNSHLLIVSFSSLILKWKGMRWKTLFALLNLKLLRPWTVS